MTFGIVEEIKRPAGTRKVLWWRRREKEGLRMEAGGRDVPGKEAKAS